VTALRTVNDGNVFDLGVTIDRRSFLAPPHVGTEVTTFRTPDGLARDGLYGTHDHGHVSFTTSVVIVSDHAGTQVDGLCHATAGSDRHWYNGFTASKHGRDFGAERAGAHKIPPIIAPGVLVDVPAALGLSELPAGYGISPSDLQSSLDRQSMDIEPGDVVLVRTGTLQHWGDVGADHALLQGPDSAGLTLAGARWLVETKGAMLVGADNSTVEVMPPVDGSNASPVHQYLLVEQGVHLGELHYLEDLAAADVHRFCYIALTPKLRGTTAGFAMRPIAVV
jgi:kynurenine formamidase